MSQHLLHISIFIPKLIGSRQNGNGSVPQVTGMIDLSISHFQFSVLQPQCNIPMIDIQCPFVNGTSPWNLLLTFLPLSIFDPVADNISIFSYIILKSFSLPVLVISKFFGIRYFLFRWLEKLQFKNYILQRIDYKIIKFVHTHRRYNL